MNLEINESTYGLIEDAIVRVDMNLEGNMIVYVHEVVFFDYGFTQEEFYSDKTQDQLYEAIVDHYADHGSPTIHVAILD